MTISVGEFWRLKSPHRRTGNRTIVRIEATSSRYLNTINLSFNRSADGTQSWAPNRSAHTIRNFLERYEKIDESELPDYWREFNDNHQVRVNTITGTRPDYSLNGEVLTISTEMYERVSRYVNLGDWIQPASPLKPKPKTKRKTGFGKFVSKLEEQSNGSNNPSSS